jgi:hypothetical protein
MIVRLNVPSMNHLPKMRSFENSKLNVMRQILVLAFLGMNEQYRPHGTILS